MVYVKNNYSTSIIDMEGDNSLFELLWIKLTHNSRKIAVGALYHPPKPVYDTNTFLQFLTNSSEKISNDFDLIILAGDFNGLQASNISELTGLQDLVTNPTRGTNILDHIFVSNILYDKTKVIKSLTFTDHFAIVAYNGEVKVCTTKTRQRHTFRQKTPFNNAAYLSHHSTIPSSALHDPTISNVQHSFNHFYDQAHALLDSYFPLRTTTLTSSDPDYITPEIKTLLRLKNTQMHKGNLEVADALAAKIGKLITKHNSKELTHLNSETDSFDLWAAVRKVNGKKKIRAQEPKVCLCTLRQNEFIEGAN